MKGSMERSLVEVGDQPERAAAVAPSPAGGSSAAPGPGPGTRSSGIPAEGAAPRAEGDAKPYGSKAPDFIKRSRSLHLIWRIGIFVAGFAVVGTGVILLPLPGPGWVVIFGGMAIWASEFTWAQAVLRWTKRKVTRATRRALRPETRRRNIALASAALVVVAVATGTLITRFGLLDRSVF
ncbi:TIGR02611 family protein [Streptomyces fructofermentans]|uniref:TIGR02611 family protein n=1 Tax=Streptomyces fructofermentans TaxID=152141 RepID=A0A918U4T8_9ACTN|nr:TIGR02611 family protein [Streptomyces fructofermentans]GGX94316.1 hypothetical protein GCM10010515_71470 [Streptomyces fructofermentans]